MKERLAEVGFCPPLLRLEAVLGLVDGDKMGGGDVPPPPSFLDLSWVVLCWDPPVCLGDTPYLGDGEVLYLGEALADFDEGLPDLLSDPIEPGGGLVDPESGLVCLKT